jgi:hypothetical protein
MLSKLNPHLTPSEYFLLVAAIIVIISAVRGVIWLAFHHPWLAAVVIGCGLLYIFVGMLETSR